ncbi:MAG: hypothetical protein U0270_25665 [Labilithrix sp.]
MEYAVVLVAVMMGGGGLFKAMGAKVQHSAQSASVALAEGAPSSDTRGPRVVSPIPTTERVYAPKPPKASR